MNPKKLKEQKEREEKEARDALLLSNSKNVQKLCMHVRIANMAKHSEDVKQFLDQLIDFKEEIGEDFSADERYLISMGYKNYIGDIQVAARVVTLISKTPKYRTRYTKPIQTFKRKQQERLRSAALEIAALLKGKVYKISKD